MLSIRMKLNTVAIDSLNRMRSPQSNESYQIWLVVLNRVVLMCLTMECCVDDCTQPTNIDTASCEELQTLSSGEDTATTSLA